VLVLEGKCGRTAEIRAEHCAPCHLPNLDGLFFLAQEGYDTMTALLETLLDGLVLLPTRYQAVCNRWV
jgi:hypothetical protein